MIRNSKNKQVQEGGGAEAEQGKGWRARPMRRKGGKGAGGPEDHQGGSGAAEDHQGEADRAEDHFGRSDGHHSKS